MKFKPTPLNIVSGLTIGFAIYSAFNSGPMGLGFILTIYLLPVGFVGLFIDYLLQKTIQNRLTIIIESCFLFLVLLWYYSSQRTKTLIIPDNLRSRYIVTIYGVDSAAKLPNGWNYELKVPANGIILTSSSFQSDLRQTKIKTTSGLDLSSPGSKLGWGRITDDDFVCKGKSFHFQIWMVNETCCMYSSHEIEEFKKDLQLQFCAE